MIDQDLFICDKYLLICHKNIILFYFKPAAPAGPAALLRPAKGNKDCDTKRGSAAANPSVPTKMLYSVVTLITIILQFKIIYYVLSDWSF